MNFMQFLHLSTRELLDSAPIAPIAQSATPKTADRLVQFWAEAIGSQHRQSP